MPWGVFQYLLDPPRESIPISARFPRYIINADSYCVIKIFHLLSLIVVGFFLIRRFTAKGRCCRDPSYPIIQNLSSGRICDTKSYLRTHHNSDDHSKHKCISLLIACLLFLMVFWNHIGITWTSLFLIQNAVPQDLHCGCCYARDISYSKRVLLRSQY